MTREQELEKMMKWFDYNGGSAEFNFDLHKWEIEYSTGGVGNCIIKEETFEKCIRKAMQQEGEL